MAASFLCHLAPGELCSGGGGAPMRLLPAAPTAPNHAPVTVKAFRSALRAPARNETPGTLRFGEASSKFRRPTGARRLLSSACSENLRRGRGRESCATEPMGSPGLIAASKSWGGIVAESLRWGVALHSHSNSPILLVASKMYGRPVGLRMVWVGLRMGGHGTSSASSAAVRAVVWEGAEGKEQKAANGAVAGTMSPGPVANQEVVPAGSVGEDDPGQELSWDALVGAEVAAEVTNRLQRLEVLMLVRRVYRDVSRSERVARMPVPRIAREREGTQELKVRRRIRRQGSSWLRTALEGERVLLGERLEGEREGEGEDDVAPEPIEVESASEVLELAGDVRDLAVSLQNGASLLQGKLHVVFPEDAEVEGRVRTAVEQLEGQLLALAQRIEQSLAPEDREAAAREKEQQLRQEEENVQARVLRRLEGLTSTGQAVGQRIAGVGQGLSRIDLAASLSSFSLLRENAQQAGASAAQTLEGLWRRLNGLPASCDLDFLAAKLPRPQSTLAEQEERKLALLLEVEALDKKLTEASKAREARLRQRNSPARTRLLASEIRALDDEVNDVRKQLAVRVLQLEMQLIYSALESELLVTAGADDIRTDEEEALIIAEFGLLDTDLAPLRTAVDRQEAILIDDDVLDVLALDIPDLKQRLGIVEDPTVPVSQRVQMAVAETQGKLSEGSGFLWRGLRLLGGDILYSLRLFWIAANGTTLKAREVQTLRRTAKDLLVIIPFTIILIVPITPVGHVLVFSFIQKYFPGFFPSSFSSRRQEVMERYELLKLELESGSALASVDREAAAAMAAAEAETFEAREEEEGPAVGGAHKAPEEQGGLRLQLQWLLPGLGGALGPSADRGSLPGSSAKELADDPRKLRLLQEKLPGISSFLADLKGREGSRPSAGPVQAPPQPSQGTDTESRRVLQPPTPPPVADDSASRVGVENGSVSSS